MGKEIERFQKDVEDILNRFEKQARELNAIYAKLNSTQLNGKFNFKLDLDNGIKVGSLLLTIGGTIAAVIGTGGWILAIGLAGLVFLLRKPCGASSTRITRSLNRKNLSRKTCAASPSSYANRYAMP